MKLIGKRALVQISDSVVLAIFLLMLCSGVYLLNTQQPLYWVDLLYDDAYYYLGVARGLIESRGSSFLPPFETNGYQPLWLLILWASGTVFGGSDHSLALQMYVIAFLATLAFAYASKKQYHCYFPALILAVTFSSIMLAGLETALIPVLFIAYMASSRWQMKGLIGSLLFLARLDALSLVAARDLYSLVKGEKIDLKPYLIIVPTVLIYFLINHAYFGTPVPISGLSKSIGNITGENFRVILAYIVQAKTPALLLIAVAAYRFSFSLKFELKYMREISIATIALCCCITYYTLNSGWPVLWGWYFWPILLISYYLCLELVDVFISHQRARIGAQLLVIPAVALIAIYCFSPSLDRITERLAMLNLARTGGKPEATFATKNLELVQFAHANIPKGTYLAMGDRAGSFGFFLGGDYKFLHTEGLVGPQSYYQAMKKNAGAGFFSGQNIDYLIADREQYLEDGQFVGVIEPIQGLSSHVGPYLICYDKAAIVLDQSYGVNQRYVFSSQHRAACPAAMKDQFNHLRDQYAGIRDFSLPSEPGGKRMALLLAKLSQRKAALGL